MALYQEFLDRSGAAIANRDFNAFATHFVFPQTLEIEGKVTEFSDKPALAEFFEALVEQLDLQDAEGLDRICKDALFMSADTITGYHQTRVVRRDAYVVASFEGLCTLRLVDRHWRLSTSYFSDTDTKLPAAIIRRFLHRQPSPLKNGSPEF